MIEQYRCYNRGTPTEAWYRYSSEQDNWTLIWTSKTVHQWAIGQKYPRLVDFGFDRFAEHEVPDDVWVKVAQYALL